MRQKPNVIDANGQLLEVSRELQSVVLTAVLRLGIWVDPRTYLVRPHLVPFAVRDASSRSKASHDGSETWGAPDPDGFFRDDRQPNKIWHETVQQGVGVQRPTIDGT